MNKEELAKLYYDTNLQRGKNKAEAGNYLLSGIMKALEWSGAGALHGAKKGAPWAPLDEWKAPWNNPELSYKKPWTWDWDPGNQYGALGLGSAGDFWTSWKPDVADIPGELAHFLRPFPNPFSDKTFPEWGEEWKKKHDFYPFGSTGDQFGLAGVGNFQKNPKYSALQEQLANSSPEELGDSGYVRIVPNPIYKNITPNVHSSLMMNIPNNQFDSVGMSKEKFIESLSAQNPFISEYLYDKLNEWGLGIPEDQKKDGFYISQDFLTPKDVQFNDGSRGKRSSYDLFIDSINKNAEEFLYDEYGKINHQLKERFMDNSLLWSTVARMDGMRLGGDMSSVIMDPEDKLTNFSHEKFMDTSRFLGGGWDWTNQDLNPMAITTGPMMNKSLPVIGEWAEEDAVVTDEYGREREAPGIINEFKRQLGLEDFKPGTKLMELMHDQYPLGDPQYIEWLKNDLEETGRTPNKFENFMLHFPEAFALTAGPKIKGVGKGSKMMGDVFSAGQKLSLSPFNVFAPHQVLPYSRRTPLSIYGEVKDFPVSSKELSEGLSKDLGPLENVR